MARGRKKQGFGDTLENIFEATGVKAVVKFFAGEDCNCDERRKKLNAIFPHYRPNCLHETEFLYLDEFFKQKKTDIKPSEQFELLKIYNRALNQKQEPTSCGSCWADMLNNLTKLYEAYKEENQ